MRRVIEECYCDLCGKKVEGEDLYGITMPMGTDKGENTYYKPVPKDAPEGTTPEVDHVEIIDITPTVVFSDIDLCGDCIREHIHIYTNSAGEFADEPAPMSLAPYNPEEEQVLVV